MPASPMTNADSQLKIVMFLRKSFYTTFWEEVEQVVQMIAAFPGVELAIKLHTRGGWKQSLTNKNGLRRLQNVSIVADNIHSSSPNEMGRMLLSILLLPSYLRRSRKKNPCWLLIIYMPVVLRLPSICQKLN